MISLAVLCLPRGHSQLSPRIPLPEPSKVTLPGGIVSEINRRAIIEKIRSSSTSVFTRGDSMGVKHRCVD